MLVSRIISGGQTGADRGGLDAAMELGIAHGGYCPRGRLAEDGAVPAIYQLVETDDNDYRTRTRLNVDNADATLVFVKGGLSGGSLYTWNYCLEAKKPAFMLAFGIMHLPEGDVKNVPFLREKLGKLVEKLGRPLVLNVAGNRESRYPGMQVRVKELLYLALKDDV